MNIKSLKNINIQWVVIIYCRCARRSFALCCGIHSGVFCQRCGGIQLLNSFQYGRWVLNMAHSVVRNAPVNPPLAYKKFNNIEGSNHEKT